MQHQSQNSQQDSAAKAGLVDSSLTITSAEIERHIARGKRMQAEAIAAFFRGGVRRLSVLFHPGQGGKSPQGVGSVSGKHLSRA